MMRSVYVYRNILQSRVATTVVGQVGAFSPSRKTCRIINHFFLLPASVRLKYQNVADVHGRLHVHVFLCMHVH